MNKEIELKAWVEAPDKIKHKLESLYGEAEDFIKNDIYYIYRNISDGLEQAVRLRSESGGNVVTVKQKTLEDGVEINNEIEFEVDNQENFLKYLVLTGAEKYYTKKKTGWKFKTVTEAGQAVIELCQVHGLGWFLEIEIVIDSPNTEQVKRAQDQLYSILNEAGLAEGSIEARFYSEMILQDGV